AGDRGDVQNASVIPFEHVRQYRARGQKRADDVDFENEAKIPELDFVAFDIRLAGYARAVDQNVNAPESFGDLIDHGFDLVFVRHVADEVERILADRFDRRLERGRIQINHRNARALAAQLFRYRQPDPRRAAGDDCSLIFE